MARFRENTRGILRLSMEPGITGTLPSPLLWGTVVVVCTL